jgi:hypothetical protein
MCCGLCRAVACGTHAYDAFWSGREEAAHGATVSPCSVWLKNPATEDTEGTEEDAGNPRWESGDVWDRDDPRESHPCRQMPFLAPPLVR